MHIFFVILSTSLMKTQILKFSSRAVLVAKNCLNAMLLPLTLTLLFVIQNIVFNRWLHITPQVRLEISAATFALGMLLYGPAACLHHRSRHIYLMVISLLASIILMVEYLYYSYAGGFLQISALKLSGESSAVVGTAITFITPHLLFFLSSPAIVLLSILLLRHKKTTHSALMFQERLVIAFVVLVSIFGGYHTLLAAETKNFGDSTRLYKQLYDLNSVVGKMGIVNYFLEDAAKRALNVGRVTEADKTFVTNWSAARPDPIISHNDFGIAKGRNLIFIQVESLENAVIQTKIGGAEITPRMNALAKEGMYFSHYYAQVDMGNTADAEFTTLNSLYPLTDSIAFIDHAQKNYAALPQLLVDNGYNTNIFHGDVSTFWNRANIYPHLGYQNWILKDSFTITRKIGITGLGDEEFFQQSFSKITSLKQPFMATLMTLSAHTPFILPDDLRTLSIPPDSGLSDYQAQYLESVHYTDKVIGDFIDQLKQTDLYNNSVIVIFGDHGSYTDISEILNVGMDNVDRMYKMQVPLIILVPGTKLIGEQTLPGSHIDIYPTMTNLLGLETPRSVLGQDLLNTTTPVVVRRKGGTGAISAILASQHIFVTSKDGTFENGSCLDSKTRQPVAIETCRSLYDQQSAILKVSDTVVRANMIGVLK